MSAKVVDEIHQRIEEAAGDFVNTTGVLIGELGQVVVQVWLDAQSPIAALTAGLLAVAGLNLNITEWRVSMCQAS